MKDEKIIEMNNDEVIEVVEKESLCKKAFNFGKKLFESDAVKVGAGVLIGVAATEIFEGVKATRDMNNLITMVSEIGSEDDESEEDED